MQLGLEQFFTNQPQFTLMRLVGDGYLAIDAAQTLKPDLIVMDVGLPKLDGIAATQQIKAGLPEVRVLMLTSHDTETEIVAALASGADAYCIKGTSLDRLMVAIAAIQDGGVYLDPQVGRVIKHLKPPVAGKSEVHLSEREREVLQLIVEGKSNPEIAAVLYLSLSTVKTYVRGIMNKLAVDDRVQAAVVALRSGLV